MEVEITKINPLLGQFSVTYAIARPNGGVDYFTVFVEAEDELDAYRKVLPRTKAHD